MPDGYRLTKHRGKWAFTTGSGSDLRRRSTGTDDLGRAEAIARRMWAAMQAPTSERVEDLWTHYLEDRQQEGKGVTRQKDAWKRLAPIFAVKLGNEVIKDDCRGYAALRRRQGASIGTARTELEYLRACLNMKYGKGNTHVWVPQAPAPRDRYLTKEEVEVVANAADAAHVKLFVILAVTTGARMSAILELKWSQIDWKHRTVNFNPLDRQQTHKRRPEIRLNDRAYAALEEQAKGALTDWVIEWAGRPVASVKKSIARLAAKAGVPCSPHVFRHTAGVWMAQADVPMQKISQYLGHTSSRCGFRGDRAQHSEMMSPVIPI